MEIDNKIEAYINGTMSTIEATAFEKKVSANIELQEAVTLAININLYIKDDEALLRNRDVLSNAYATFIKSDKAIALKKTIKTVSKEYATKKTKKRIPYFAVASVVILFVSLFFIQSVNNKPKDLFLVYYSNTDLPSVIKRSDTNNNLVQGVIQFKKKEYLRAITHFEGYKKNTKDTNPSVYLYDGVAKMNLHKYEEAEEAFNLLIHSDAIDAEKGYWFKALLYLKNDKPNKSKAILEKIVKDKLYNFNKAKILLEDIS